MKFFEIHVWFDGLDIWPRAYNNRTPHFAVTRNDIDYLVDVINCAYAKPLQCVIIDPTDNRRVAYTTKHSQGWAIFATGDFSIYVDRNSSLKLGGTPRHAQIIKAKSKFAKG